MDRKMIIGLLSGSILLLALALGIHYYVKGHQAKPRHPVACSTYQQVDGIDISHHNGFVNFDTMPAETKFVYIKATEGSSFKDSSFEDFCQQAHEVGMKCGAYHYLRWTTSASRQFENFKSATANSDMDLIPVIDCEYGNNELDKETAGSSTQAEMNRQKYRRELATFIALCKDYYGCNPIIYSTPEFNRNIICDAAEGCPRWLSTSYAYRLTDDTVLWQMGTGKIGGDYFDCNQFVNGSTLEDLIL